MSDYDYVGYIPDGSPKDSYHRSSGDAQIDSQIDEVKDLCIKLQKAGCRISVPQDGKPRILIPKTGVSKRVSGLVDRIASYGVNVEVEGDPTPAPGSRAEQIRKWAGIK